MNVNLSKTQNVAYFGGHIDGRHVDTLAQIACDKKTDPRNELPGAK